MCASVDMRGLDIVVLGSHPNGSPQKPSEGATQMDEVRRTLDELNRAWRDQRFGDLPRFFDENVVMRSPNFKEFGRGREALIQSYVQFMTQSKVIEYAESNHSVESWSDTAVATYDWAMTYEQAGKTSRGSGQDMFVFVRRESRWMAALRVMLF
jgi:hypothetical protein